MPSWKSAFFFIIWLLIGFICSLLYILVIYVFTHEISYKQPTKDTTAPIIDATMDNGGVEEVEADVVEGAVAEEADTKNQKSQRKN